MYLYAISHERHSALHGHYRGHMESPDLAALRAEYAREGLDEADAGTDPVDLFGQWLDDAVAAGIHEPNAMALATADASGRPSVRIVLLKGFDEHGAVFYTNYDSRKGRELERQPVGLGRAALAPAAATGADRAAGSSASTPPSPTPTSAHAHAARRSAPSRRSSPGPIEDREALEAQVADVERTFDGRDVERPEQWGGYRIALDELEFWQGRPNRVHDRLRFTRSGDGWSRERLQP